MCRWAQHRKMENEFNDSAILDEQTQDLPPTASHWDLIPDLLRQQLKESKNVLWSEAARARYEARTLPRPFQPFSSTAKLANLGSLSNLPPPKYEINKHICVVAGDLTELATEAYIVPFGLPDGSCSALAAKVHAKAGIQLSQELRRLQANPRIGEAIQTPPFNLQRPDRTGVKYPFMIYHAVAPVQEDPQALKSAYERALYLTASDGMKTVAVPLLAGSDKNCYMDEHYPVVGTVHVMLSVLRSWLERDDIRAAIDLVVVVAQNERQRWVLNELMDLYFPHEPGVIIPDEVNDFAEKVVEAAPKKSKKGKKAKGKKGKKGK